jgi:hypothetical protein
MRRPGRVILRILLAGLVFFALFVAFWFGMVPQRYSPFAAITLGERPSWFVDVRLAALRRDPELCRAVLREPHIAAAPIPDNPIRNGCGWMNAVRLSTAGGAELGAAQLTCEAAAALALWVEYEVQPLALAAFGARVTGLQDMGTYACRNIIGNEKWAKMRSQHALANAVDIGGFTLEDGRQISVAKAWKGHDREARFLHAVHARACRYFRVAIGPDYNRAHWNHFHFDRGVFTRCR